MVEGTFEGVNVKEVTPGTFTSLLLAVLEPARSLIRFLGSAIDQDPFTHES